jgi:hypothetical protein
VESKHLSIQTGSDLVAHCDDYDNDDDEATQFGDPPAHLKSLGWSRLAWGWRDQPAWEQVT